MYFLYSWVDRETDILPQWIVNTGTGYMYRPPTICSTATDDDNEHYDETEQDDGTDDSDDDHLGLGQIGFLSLSYKTQQSTNMNHHV